MKIINLKVISALIIGSLLMSIGINCFYVPYHLLSGGITGIAMLLHLTLNIDITLAVLFMNIPIFIAGFFFLSKRFMLYSFIGLLNLSLFITLTKSIIIPTNNIISALVLGGVLNGLGLGIIYRYGASLGGTDVISKIINKYFSYSLSIIGFYINVIVIGLSVAFFGVDLSVYTLMSMFVSSKIIQYVVEGLNYKRMVIIISNINNNDIISKTIMKKLKRGITLINGKGGYTNNDKYVLYCVIGIRQVSKLRTIVKELDPDAFITITQTVQVFGNGFLKMYDE